MNGEHVPYETLVAYWAKELSEAESSAVEEHLFSCDGCSSQSLALGETLQLLRGAPATVVTESDVSAMRSEGQRVTVTAMLPGARTRVAFTPEVDLLVHRLGGLELSGLERVDLSLRAEGGPVFFEQPDVAFDPKAGGISILCSRHYAVFPPNIVATVQARGAGGEERVLGEYTILHEFAG